MHESLKDGSRGVFFLFSSFLRGLTYSALYQKAVMSLNLKVWWQMNTFQLTMTSNTLHSCQKETNALAKLRRCHSQLHLLTIPFVTFLTIPPESATKWKSWKCEWVTEGATNQSTWSPLTREGARDAILSDLKICRTVSVDSFLSLQCSWVRLEMVVRWKNTAVILSPVC